MMYYRICFTLIFLGLVSRLNSQSTKIVLPEGHIDAVLSAVFSPDAQKFITVSADGTAKVWETGSGKMLMDFKKQGEGESMPVSSAGFSPDGESIFVNYLMGSNNRIVNMKRGIDQKQEYRSNPTEVAQYSLDGKKLVLSDTIYNAKTLRPLLPLSGLTGTIQFLGFTRLGQILSCSQEENDTISYLRSWNSLTGKPISRKIEAGTDIAEISLTADRSRLILRNRKSWSVIDATTLKTLFQIFSDLDLNYPNDKLISNRSASHLLLLTGHYLLDSTDLLGTGEFVYDSASVFDTRTRKVLLTRNLALTGNPDRFDFFSPDGKIMLLPAADSSLQAFDLQTSKDLFQIKSWYGEITGARFSANGKWILTITPDNVIRSYQTNNGSLISRFNGHRDIVNDARFSDDGSKILSAGADRTAIVWSTSTARPVSIAQKKTTNLSGAAFKKDGSKIVIYANGRAIAWDIAATRLEKPLAAETDPRGNRPKDTTLLETVRPFFYSNPVPDSNEQEFEFLARGYISPDKKYSIQWPHPKVIEVTDNLHPDSQRTFWNPNLEHFNSVQFSPDSKYLLVTTEYNVMQLLSIQTGEILFTFVLIDSSNFLVTDSRNHYDGTRAAREMIHFTCGDEVIELSQVKEQLWVPGLAERIIAGDSINALTLEQLNICNKVPLIEDISTDSLYRFRIQPRSGGLGKTLIGLNGYEYKGLQPRELIKTGTSYEIRLRKAELRNYFDEDITNLITVSSTTAKGDLPSRVLTKAEYFDSGKKDPPNFFAVFVGTSNYKEDRMDLQFAAIDAEKMAATLEDAAGKLLGKEHVFVYPVTTDNKKLYPEKGTIKKIFDEISRKATPKDILLIFLSGHGVMDDKTKEFYYLTADASSLVDENLFKNAGISMSELTAWIRPQLISARKRVLILDACQSGQAINNLLALNRNMLGVKGDEEARQIKAIEKLNSKSGLYILSASASTQSAYESEEYGHGYLTYSLLKLIKENPGILDDRKYLNVTNWFREAAELVSELAKKDQSRQEPQVVSTTSFNIGLVDQELVQNISLQSQKPLFIPGNFLNRDESIADDDLGLRKMIDTELQRLAGEEGGKKIVFSGNSDSPEAYSLSGSYLVKEKAVDIKIRLKRGNVILFTEDLTGYTDQLKTLVSQITSRAIQWIREQSVKTESMENE